LQLQLDLQSAFQASGLAPLSKSNLKIVKMHDTTHHLFGIMLFEDPQTYSTEIGEFLNKKLVKEIFCKGNRHESFDFVGIRFLLDFGTRE